MDAARAWAIGLRPRPPTIYRRWPGAMADPGQARAVRMQAAERPFGARRP